MPASCWRISPRAIGNRGRPQLAGDAAESCSRRRQSKLICLMVPPTAMLNAHGSPNRPRAVTRREASHPGGRRMVEAKRSIVAIVDDDDGVRQSLSFLIELIGHEVEEFADAAEFLKAELRHIA